MNVFPKILNCPLKYGKLKQTHFKWHVILKYLLVLWYIIIKVKNQWIVRETDGWMDTWMEGPLLWHLKGFICFIGLLGHNGLYMMTPHPCQIPPWSKETHIHHHLTHTHIHMHPQFRSMVINLISDKPDTCTHEAFGRSVSLDHSFSNTHSHAHTHSDKHFFPTPSFPWQTCQAPRWPLTPPHFALLLIFLLTLSIWDEEGWGRGN